MNRKISTLFTAGLLMAGSLCGSAWAQSSIQQLAGFVNGQGTFTATPATELKAGHQYVFVNDQTNNEAYGHELSGSTITESKIRSVMQDSSIMMMLNSMFGLLA